MIIPTISILLLTLSVWVINKKLPIQICSICAGVTLTWLWMFGGMWLGFISVSRYEFQVAILMGVTIGGLVTELKKMSLKFRNKNGLKENEEIEPLEDKLKNCC